MSEGGSNKDFWREVGAVLSTLPGRYVAVLLCTVPFVWGLVALAKSENSSRPAVLYPVGILLVMAWGALTVMLWRGSAPGGHPRSQVGGVQITWSRYVLGERIPGDVCQALHKLLEEARHDCWEVVRQNAAPTIETTHVCANLFLFVHGSEVDRYANGFVDDDGIWAGEVGVLRMPRGFRIHMGGRSDEDIRFRPYNGATGNAFMTGESYDTVPVGSPRDAASWGVNHRLHSDQLMQLDERLKWIITVPVKSQRKGGESSIYAIINVDGLVHHIDERTLKSMKPIVLSYALRASTLFEDLAKKRLVIGYQI